MLKLLYSLNYIYVKRVRALRIGYFSYRLLIRHRCIKTRQKEDFGVGLAFRLRLGASLRRVPHQFSVCHAEHGRGICYSIKCGNQILCVSVIRGKLQKNMIKYHPLLSGTALTDHSFHSFSGCHPSQVLVFFLYLLERLVNL
jgi:hypothetical protein